MLRERRLVLLVVTLAGLSACGLFDAQTYHVEIGWSTPTQTGSTAELPDAIVGVPFAVSFHFRDVNPAPPNCDLSGGVRFPKIEGAIPPGLSRFLRGVLNTASTMGESLQGIPTTPGTYVLEVEQTFAAKSDGLACSATGDRRFFTLTVRPAPVSAITTSSLPNGTVGSAYSTALQGTGPSPLVWALAAGSGVLPPGLALVGATIAGTPTAAGSYDITVELQAGSAAPVTRDLTIVIDPAPGSQFSISTTSLPDGAVGEVYSQMLMVQNGIDSDSWTIQSGALPPGTSLNLGSGEIAGIPSATGTFNFTVEVFDQSTPPVRATRGLSITVVNPVPAITSLNPSSTVAGSGAVGVDVDGTGFVSGSVVLFNGSNAATVVNSSTQVRALLMSADVTAAGTAQVVVRNPVPGGGDSNALTFTIANPVPVLTVLMPNNANAGSAAFTLTALGSDLVASTVLRWNGVDRATNFISGTEIRAQIGAADVQTAGNVAATAFTPGPGGGSSAPLTFTINPAVPPPPGGAGTGVTGVISVSTAGVLANGSSGVTAGEQSLDLSEDGDVVVFQSEATNLDLGHGGVFVRRVSTGVTRQLTYGLLGATPDAGPGDGAAISSNRFWVAFASHATNLVLGDTSTTSMAKIFLANSCVTSSPVPVICPTPELVSVTSGGAQPNAGSSGSPDLSADGDRIVFASNSNLLSGFGTTGNHIWLRDRTAGTTEMVSVDDNGAPAAGTSFRPRISGNGRFVVFVSSAANLVPNDTNGRDDVFIRDTCFNGPGGCTPTTQRVSIGALGAEQTGGSYNGSADISHDGRYVVFDSDATNLVPAGTPTSVFERDRLAGTTVSFCDSPVGCRNPSVSGDGRLVSYEFLTQIWIADTCIGAAAGCVQNAFGISHLFGTTTFANNGGAEFARISRDGYQVVFTSFASNLGANNGFKHVYRAVVIGP